MHRQAVKYSARACSSVVSPIPATPQKDFLRAALRTTLQDRDCLPWRFHYNLGHPAQCLLKTR